ncbi:glucose-6-phosphate dehydrogenase assembly protein OpcA [candidate division KSB1 bacterium]|nr:glucose-6-phosphate dehydrogenase assembly protein OpcA [candidate division KSB1 bacterium]
MSETGPAVYALADPCEVDVAAIERELETLWRDAAKGGDTESVTRATAFNLVYVAPAADDNAGNLLARLTLAHPSRSILLRMGDPAAPPTQTAWVTAYCHQPAPNAPQICSEFISLEVTGSGLHHIASTLLSLMLPGLPIVLIWDAAVDSAHPLLLQFGHSANRVITDLIRPASSAAALREFFSLRQLLGRDAVCSDLCWTRLQPRRVAFVRWYESTSRPPIRGLRLPASGLSAADLLFACWIETTLHHHGGSPVCEIVADANTTELLLADGRVQAAPEAQVERAMTDLISAELRVWGRDPVMESTLNLARARLERRA